MHEATIAMNILRSIQERVKDGMKVETIKIRIGAFRNVDPESLTFSFDNLKSDFDSLASANLELTLIQAEALCQKQRHKYNPMLSNGYRCMKCNSGIGQLLQGEELELTGYSVIEGEEQLHA